MSTNQSANEVDVGDLGSHTDAPTWRDLDLSDPGEPRFLGHCWALVNAVRDHDLQGLTTLCDDTFGIVDLGPDGTAVAVEDPAGHREWFSTLFARLEEMDAATWTELTRLRSQLLGQDAALVDLRMTQSLRIGEQTGRFHCAGTVVFKRVEGRWVEARWHLSLLGTELPDGFGAG